MTIIIKKNEIKLLYKIFQKGIMLILKNNKTH